MQSRISWFCWSKEVVVEISVAIEYKRSIREHSQPSLRQLEPWEILRMKYGRLHGWAAFLMHSGYTCVVQSRVHCTVHAVCAWIVHGAPHLVNKHNCLTLEVETSFSREDCHSTWSCGNGYPNLRKKWTKLEIVDPNLAAKHFSYPDQAMHGAIIHAPFCLVNERPFVKWDHSLRDASAP